MKKSETISNQIISDIESGVFGKSGERFLSTRELCDKYRISNKTAIGVLKTLELNGAIVTFGYKHFLLNGRADPNAPLFAETKREEKFVGFHVREIANEFMSNILKLFISVAKAHGYRVIIACSNNDKADELSIMSDFIKLNCRGFVSFSHTYFTNEAFFRRLPIPYVLCGSINPNLNANYITTSNFTAGEQAAKHLLSCGYNTFCYLGINPEKETRRHGFSAFLQQENIPAEKVHIYKYAENMLPAELFDFIETASELNRVAIFCYHDLIAVNLYAVIKKCGKKIPEEVGVVGFDNLPVSNMLSPKLTSISYSYLDLAEKFFEVLHSHIKDPLLPPQRAELFAYLIVKNSTGKPE